VRSHLDRHHLLIADQAGDVIGVLAYRTDWFQCTFVTLVSVREDHRKRGIARALYRAVEGMSPSPRLFSSTEETTSTTSRRAIARCSSTKGYARGTGSRARLASALARDAV